MYQKLRKKSEVTNNIFFYPLIVPRKLLIMFYQQIWVLIQREGADDAAFIREFHGSPFVWGKSRTEENFWLT